MCSLILRDESGHVAFHLDRLALKQKTNRLALSSFWRAQFWLCGVAAGTMLWVNHARALRTFGGRTSEFYGEIFREMSRFIRRLDRRTRAEASAHAPEVRPDRSAAQTYAAV